MLGKDDNMKKKHSTIIASSILIFSIILFQGCVNIDNTNSDQPSPLNNDEERFVGEWAGEQKNQQINISITLNNDRTGYFQLSKINWSVNENILTISMFNGESISEYHYFFVENNATLTLKNVYNDEEFLLERQ